MGSRPIGGFKRVDQVNTQRDVGINDAGGAQSRLNQIVGNEKEVGYGYLQGQERMTARGQELQKEMQAAEISRLNREIDLARGRERGQQDFYEGSLGRVGDTLSPELQSLQAQRMDIATKGLGADALQAAREQRLSGLNRDTAMQQRQLRAAQASSGVAGPLAGAQQMSLLSQQQKGRQQAERELLLDNANRRQESISAAEGTVRGNQADVLQRQQYNLANKKGELMGRLTSQYGEAALGVAERGAATSAQAAKDYAQAVRSSGGGKK